MFSSSEYLHVWGQYKGEHSRGDAAAGTKEGEVVQRVGRGCGGDGVERQCGGDGDCGEEIRAIHIHRGVGGLMPPPLQ